MDKYSVNGGFPGPVPAKIRLANGRWRTNTTPYTAEEMASANVVLAPPAPDFDPATQRLTWDGAAWGVTDLPVPDPQPVPLSVLDFELHVQAAAGLTDAQVVAMLDDANLKLVWHRLGRVSEVNRDHPLVQGGLDALVATNHLTAPQRADVVADWPVV